MSGYALSREAWHDLDEIWDYISEDNVDAADRWIGKLLGECESLARNPRIGHSRNDLTDLPILFWPVDAYFVIYRIRELDIEIVAVTQGSRDVPKLLRGRS